MVEVSQMPLFFSWRATEGVVFQWGPISHLSEDAPGFLLTSIASASFAGRK